MRRRLCRRAWMRIGMALAAPAWLRNRFTQSTSPNSWRRTTHVQEQRRGLPRMDRAVNGSSDVVNLAGWFLSDSPTNLTKWRFPAVRILPAITWWSLPLAKSSPTIWRISTPISGPIKMGVTSHWWTSDDVVSEFAPGYPKQSPDVSYGRVRGEPDLCGYFLPTDPWQAQRKAVDQDSRRRCLLPPQWLLHGSVRLDLSCHLTKCRHPLHPRRATAEPRFPAYRTPILLTNTACVRARF